MRNDTSRCTYRAMNQLEQKPPVLLYTIDESARALRISRRKLQQLLADGVLKAVRLGRTVRVPADELRRLAREHLS